jgi:hypothetical protein
MYYEYMTTQYCVRFFLSIYVPPFKNVFQHTFISVNNRGGAPSKYVNKLTIGIGFYFCIPEVKQYGRR